MQYRVHYFKYLTPLMKKTYFGSKNITNMFTEIRTIHTVKFISLMKISTRTSFLFIYFFFNYLMVAMTMTSNHDSNNLFIFGWGEEWAT